VARLLLLVVVVVVLAGCGDSVPGGKVVSPTPVTVVGKLPEPPYEGGNAAAGEVVFKTSCGICHTYAPAGSKATIGPSLDDLAAYAAKAPQDSFDEFTYQAIVSPPAPYVPAAFVHKETMPTSFGTSLTKKQLADLVAFLAPRS
jgi:mono/diheme cytochrome c family protein